MGSMPTGYQRPWSPYGTYKNCSQGICSIHCPQWCYPVFPPPPPPPPSFAHKNDINNDSSIDLSPLIIAIMGILASAFILVSYYILISKYCWRRSRESNSIELNENGSPSIENNNNQAWQKNTSGLPESVIKSIMVVKYKSNDGFTEVTDCSICLSEFEEEDRLRVLPNCSHAFHLPCVDKWLESHGNCPLCRVDVLPSAETTTAIITTLPPPPSAPQSQTPQPPNSTIGSTTVLTTEHQRHSTDHATILEIQDCLINHHQQQQPL